MTRKSQVVFTAPSTYCVSKCTCEEFCNKIVVTVAVYGGCAVFQIPEDFGKCIKNICTVSFFVNLGNFIRPGHHNIGFGIKRVTQNHFACELRFVCENSGNGTVKLIAHFFFIFFVGYFYEFFYGIFIERVEI